MERDRRKNVCSNRAELWFIATHLLPAILFLIPISHPTDEEQCKSPTLSAILDIRQSRTAEFRSKASLKNNFNGNTAQQDQALHEGTMGATTTQATANRLQHLLLLISFTPILFNLSPMFLNPVKNLSFGAELWVLQIVFVDQNPSWFATAFC